MFSCLQILEAFLWFVLITLLNVTLIILTLSVSRLLNLLLRSEERFSRNAETDLVCRLLLEKKKQQHYDHIRRALMWEPRGHRDMYGCVLTQPVTPEADLGVLFMHNEGYSTMCGHGVIALVTTLLQTGALAAKGQQTPVNLDTPAGLVRATA